MNRLKNSCTKRQEEAINHTVGPAMVLAGPGSGKTFVIVQRIYHLITSQGADPAHILVITFTKAAAMEMQERFHHLAEQESMPVWFGTFHAVFYHILKQSAQYRGYTIITETEKRKLIRDIIQNHKRFVYLQEEDIEEILTAVSRHKTMSDSPEEAQKQGTADSTPEIQKMKREDFLFLFTEYQNWLKEFSKFDFDDLLLVCLKLLQTDTECLSRWQTQFRYILVDEFQDISPMQYEIIRLLAAPENNLFIVGDDDQSIYGFRGASPDSMQRFLADFPEAKRILLDVNFRCHAEIVQAAGKVIAENENRIPKEIFSRHEEGLGLRICRAESEEKLREAVVGALKTEQKNGNLEDCAVICRTNLECGLWAQTFGEAGLPFVLKERPKNRFAHFVIQDICAYLALGQGECERRHFLRIMNRPVRYMKRDSLPRERVKRQELIAYYKDTPAIQEKVKRFCRDIDNLSGKRVHLQIHYIRKVIGYETYLREKYGSKKAEEFIRKGEEFETFSRKFLSVREMQTYMQEYAETIKEPQGGRDG
ncbi:MAG: ATP-dependent helicase, partial [Lachnospiraceae bacterium]|nr:ATP-dependent helicase [Lachnospiraceae bacterium]